MIEFIEKNNHAETRYCEFKGEIRWESDAKFKIIRTILGLSNVQDGGYIIIGVTEDKSVHSFKIVGLVPDDAMTFDNDSISQIANNFADPYVEINVKHFSYDEKILVVIEVRGYEEIVICKKERCDSNGKLILENGAIYTRRRRKPETTKVSSIEMREALDIVTEHRLRNEIRRLQAVGVSLTGETIQVSKTDEESFEQERAGF